MQARRVIDGGQCCATGPDGEERSPRRRPAWVAAARADPCHGGTRCGRDMPGEQALGGEHNRHPLPRVQPYSRAVVRCGQRRRASQDGRRAARRRDGWPPGRRDATCGTRGDRVGRDRRGGRGDGRSCWLAGVLGSAGGNHRGERDSGNKVQSLHAALDAPCGPPVASLRGTSDNRRLITHPLRRARPDRFRAPRRWRPAAAIGAGAPVCRGWPGPRRRAPRWPPRPALSRRTVRAAAG